MRTEEEIRAEIETLLSEVKKQEERRKSHAQDTGANRSNLGMPYIHEMNGRIAGLRWALNEDKALGKLMDSLGLGN